MRFPRRMSGLVVSAALAAGGCVRDHAEAKPLTPVDQSNAKADIAITASIRQALVRRPELSLDAKNVKIITRSGHVTLRGQVDSRQEWAFVDATARGTAGVTGVSNDLAVLAH